MGQPSNPAPVLLILAASSRYLDALAWATNRAELQYGPIAARSDPFNFTETDYYTATMGTNLRKQFFAFERLIDPAVLPDIKLETNRWESDYVQAGQVAETRPLNLDPGYITPAKLVLASTKDHSHRIYLRDGIYAEITLAYRHRRWQPLDWTYPDYRRSDYQEFFTQCRNTLLAR